MRQKVLMVWWSVIGDGKEKGLGEGKKSAQASPSATLTKVTFYIKNNASNLNALRRLVPCFIRKPVSTQRLCLWKLLYGCFKKKNCTEHKHKPFVLGIVIAYRKASFKSFSILAINFIDMLFLHQAMVRFLRIFFFLLFCFFQFSSFVFRFQVTVNITKGRF